MKQARSVINIVHEQLQRDLCTEVKLMTKEGVEDEAEPTVRWFWKAEERHQRYKEKEHGDNTKGSIVPLDLARWIVEYGRRTKSVIGSSETFSTS